MAMMMKIRELGRRIPSDRLCTIAARSLSHSARKMTERMTFYQSNASNHASHAHAHTRPPVVVLFPWLGAKEKHVVKFADHHTSKGYDVLAVKTEINEILWWSENDQKIDDLLQFSTEEQMSKRPIILHMFSVGFILYGETLLRSSLPKHQDKECFKSRVIGQIVDSPVDPRRAPYAISKVRLQNPASQKLAEMALNLFMYATYPYSLGPMCWATAWEMAHTAPALVPTLWLCSTKDSFTSAEKVEKEMIAKWEARGIPCRKKIWEDCQHVMLYKDHKEEYAQCLDQFVETVLSRPDPRIEGIPHGILQLEEKEEMEWQRNPGDLVAHLAHFIRH